MEEVDKIAKLEKRVEDLESIVRQLVSLLDARLDESTATVKRTRTIECLISHAEENLLPKCSTCDYRLKDGDCYCYGY